MSPVSLTQRGVVETEIEAASHRGNRIINNQEDPLFNEKSGHDNDSPDPNVAVHDKASQLHYP
jgi:hypothetical protein